MRCLTEVKLKVRTSEGIMNLEPGQEILVEEKLGLELISRRLVSPLEGGAWLIYSELCRGFLWVIISQADREKAISEGPEWPVFDEREIDRLRGCSREAIQAAYAAKKVLQGSRIVAVDRQGKGSRLSEKRKETENLP